MTNPNKTYRLLIITGQDIGLVPNQRFRFEQYTGILAANGIKCEISSLNGQKEQKILYSPGYFFKKVGIIIRAVRKRLRDLKRIRKGDYDAVLIVREAIMTRSLYFEKRIKKTGVPVIYDFDDAIWLQDVSDANRKFRWMKNPAKTSRIIEMADLVIAGNNFLASFARGINNNVEIIPTTIDTELYEPLDKSKPNKQVTIGWSGSITTIKHFRTSVPMLRQLKEKYGDKVRFVVIGDGNFRDLELGIEGQWWNAKTELEDLSSFDIGIMPLPDDQWSWGKCGLKGLQYMALNIPTVMSPVGVNNDIIQHGENGFLAGSDQEWINTLGMLIESPELREKIGKAGRQTVIERYSVEANKQMYLDCFNEMLNRKKSR